MTAQELDEVMSEMSPEQLKKYLRHQAAGVRLSLAKLKTHPEEFQDAFVGIAPEDVISLYKPEDVISLYDTEQVVEALDPEEEERVFQLLLKKRQAREQQQKQQQEQE
jgi:hypothetical protein